MNYEIIYEKKLAIMRRGVAQLAATVKKIFLLRSRKKFHSLPFVSCLGPFGFSPFRPVFPPFGSVCGLREVGVPVVVPRGFWGDVPYVSVS